MTWLETKRMVRSGLTNFKRNGIVSVASVLVVTITLSVIAAIIFVQAILHTSLQDIQNKVDVTIYFTTGAQEARILEMKNAVEKFPEVASVSYTSANEALTNFRERHKDDYLTIQALDELNENPLGAALNIKAKETAQYESIVKLLQGDSALAKDNANIIDKINYYQNKVVIDRLISIIDGARKLGFVVTLVLVIISIIITFNTIRLTIYFSREEINIMRLVGADNKYIRGPFMIEGVIYGVIATAFTLLLYVGVTIWFARNMTDFLSINLFSYYMSNFFQIAFIILLSGIILGSFSSFLAVRKYLQK